MLYARFVDDTTIGQVIAGASAAGRQALSEIESKRILDAIGIATAMAEPARSADEAAAAAVRAGFPAVLKVISPDVTHKSEVGGVVLGLRSEQEVRDAFERIRRSLAERAPQARFEGVAVQPMAEAGVELIAGIVRDERFGPLIVAGLGGIFASIEGRGEQLHGGPLPGSVVEFVFRPGFAQPNQGFPAFGSVPWGSARWA